jgi:hypothetical protein
MGRQVARTTVTGYLCLRCKLLRTCGPDSYCGVLIDMAVLTVSAGQRSESGDYGAEQAGA